MSGDIKEIVNNLNKANSKKDSDDDVSIIKIIIISIKPIMKHICIMIDFILVSVGYYLSNIKLSYDSITVHRAQRRKFKFNGIRSE